MNVRKGMSPRFRLSTTERPESVSARFSKSLAKRRQVLAEYSNDFEKTLAAFQANKAKVKEAREASGCEALFREARTSRKKAANSTTAFARHRLFRLPGCLPRLSC